MPQKLCPHSLVSRETLYSQAGVCHKDQGSNSLVFFFLLQFPKCGTADKCAQSSVAHLLILVSFCLRVSLLLLRLTTVLPFGTQRRSWRLEWGTKRPLCPGAPQCSTQHQSPLSWIFLSLEEHRIPSIFL